MGKFEVLAAHHFRLAQEDRASAQADRDRALKYETSVKKAADAHFQYFDDKKASAMLDPDSDYKSRAAEVNELENHVTDLQTQIQQLQDRLGEEAAACRAVTSDRDRLRRELRDLSRMLM